MSGTSAAKSSGRPRRSSAAPARVETGRQSSADPNPPRAVRRTVEGDTPKETAAAGAAIRNEVPRSTQRDWAPAADRPDPVALILEQSANRVQSLVPIRHGRMLASPFSFYRGGALVMAADLARTPSSGIYVQCCGDAHVSNFGMFATPERTAAFDVNDFDEIPPGTLRVGCHALGGQHRRGQRRERHPTQGHSSSEPTSRPSCASDWVTSTSSTSTHCPSTCCR